MIPLLPDHIDVGDWLRMQLRDGCSRIILRQRIQDIEQHVREWPLTPETDLAALAEEIRAKMNNEGRQLRGPTLFALFSFRAGCSDIHVDRMLQRIDGSAGGGSALFGETEASDARGIVSMMMRHTEASARIALGQTLEIVEHYKSISKERGERVAALEEKQTDNFKLFEQLLSLQHERDLDALREKRRDKQHEFLREKISLIAPVILSKIVSAGMAQGQGTLMGEELLRQFLKSLSADQAQAIVAALGPDQVVTMVELYERYREREEGGPRAGEAGPTGEGAPTSQGAGSIETAANETTSPSEAEEKKEKEK
jgi:hypothetical protein